MLSWESGPVGKCRSDPRPEFRVQYRRRFCSSCRRTQGAGTNGQPGVRTRDRHSRSGPPGRIPSRQTVEIITEEQRLRPTASEVERLLADSTLARQLLDWTPAVSLEEGLGMTIEWIKKHPEYYRPDQYAI